MGTDSPTASTDLETTRSRSPRREAGIGAVAATAANVAVWAAGRAADVSFLVTPVGAKAPTQVGIVLVAAVSAGGPLSTAEDTSTGVLLAAMHLLTGAAFAITASRARR